MATTSSLRSCILRTRASPQLSRPSSMQAWALLSQRQAQLNGEKEVDVAERMAQLGQFGLTAFQGLGTATMRSVGGRITTPMLPNPEVRGYPMVQTPTLLPGVGGLSPLMTYGKIGSTPRCLDEEGPNSELLNHLHEIRPLKSSAVARHRGYERQSSIIRWSDCELWG